VTECVVCVTEEEVEWTLLLAEWTLVEWTVMVLLVRTTRFWVVMLLTLWMLVEVMAVD
jgi:hypothetical protein